MDTAILAISHILKSKLISERKYIGLCKNALTGELKLIHFERHFVKKIILVYKYKLLSVFVNNTTKRNFSYIFLMLLISFSYFLIISSERI